MGSGCCGRLYEGKIHVESGGVLIRRKRGSKAIPSDPIVSSPLPNLTKDYLTIPNRFVTVHRKQSLAGTTGLDNQGNTCFINAALQCISNAVPLTDYFLTNVYLQEVNENNPLGTCGEFAGAYAELLATQWRDVNESMLPKRLLDLIFASAPQFANGQHDAHEFLAFFLDKIHEDLNRGSFHAKLCPISDSKAEKEEKRAARAWCAYLKRNSSVIVDLFQGQLKSSIRCEECQFVSTTFDTFMYLTLPLPKGDKTITLVDCFLEFTKDEALDPNQWLCPNCKKSGRATKRIDIWKVPPILIIHLKRFSFNTAATGKPVSGVKLTNRVEFPLSGLDISGYVSGQQKEPPVYDLFALTDHYGHFGGGHYTASCKNRHSQLWYKYDDDVVMEGEEAAVCSEKAYMLFYCKVSIDEYRRQCSELPNLWPHVISRKLSDLCEEVVHEQTGSTLSGFNEIDPKSKEARKSQLHVIPSQCESPNPDL